LQTPISESEFNCIRDYVADISGIVIPPEKAYLIETRLYKLMIDAGVESFSDLYDKVILPGNNNIAQKIINAITINETLWFRDAILWKGFEREVLPGFVQQLISKEKSKIRIWSAAASTGQEAYSIAMCIDNYLKRNKVTGISLSNFEIFATDISDRVLEIAQNARYDKISMTRGISEHYKAAYFKDNGNAWELDTYIKDAVRFRHFNLMESYNSIGKFDIIFCRYVLIYFPSNVKADVIGRMNEVLNIGGMFFTGNYVLYDLLGDTFDIKEYENLTYYTKQTFKKA